MSPSNKQILKNFYEEVFNNKNLDLLDKYINDSCVYHYIPYVGMGVYPDTTSGNKVLVHLVAHDSPAYGKLNPGDEIISAEDENERWDTYDQLKGVNWGQGVVGSWLKLKVRRDGQEMDFQFERALIQGFDSTHSETKDFFRHFLQKEYPDLKVTINLLVEEGDLVAVYLTNIGTNADYNRQAVWVEFDIYRMKDGKVVEAWGLEDIFSQSKQIGYLIQQPAASGTR